MKKAILVILAFVMVSAFGLTPAMASYSYAEAPDPPVIFSGAAGMASQPITDYGQDDSSNPRAYSVVDLSNGASNINWTVMPGQIIRSSYNYKTATGKIVLRLGGSPAGSVTFYLYDSTDTLIGSHTAYVATTGPATITFTNLFTSREYYVKAENVSQYTITVTGTIAQS